MEKKHSAHKEPTKDEPAQWHKKALELIRRNRTMVLATCAEHAPWAAPVYYLYDDAAFYFFSSPNALHTLQALSASTSAAVIYADGDRLDQIEGIQMTGTVAPVKSRFETVSVTARYLTKFPLAQALLGNAASAIGLGKKTTLYRLVPEKVYFTDNRSGFGRRLEIEL